MNMPSGAPVSIGVISDTHGLLRPQAVDALRGCDWLIHAGDVGRQEILTRLGARWPVVAVRGNIDKGTWADPLPRTQTLQVGETWLHVVHDVHDLDLNPQAASIRVVVSGHSHRASIREENGVLFVNPGSAGPRRFKLPVSVARLEIDARGGVAARLIELVV